MNVLHRLAYKVIQRLHRVRPDAGVCLPGIYEVAASARADGYHLIARSISLSATYLLFQYAFAPEPADDAEVWLNMFYDADVSPADWNYVGAGDDVQYTRL